MPTVSDKTIIIGILAIGVFLGVTWTYEVLNIDASKISFINDVLAWIWFGGLLLIISGVIYKVVKWKS